MHAYLIVGNENNRLSEINRLISAWNIEPVDTVNLQTEEQSITIADVRAFQKRLLLSPMRSGHTAGIIWKAARLTVEAQQAMLKLLEEPPPHAYIICESDAADLLLPTIVSRCQVIRLASEHPVDAMHDSIQQTIHTLLDANPGTIMNTVDTHSADREQAKMWAGLLLSAGRSLMLQHYAKSITVPHPQKIVRMIRKLQIAASQLALNCNPKLVMDRVFLTL